jgi:outer membrane lipoprotein SlyB
MNSVSTKSLRRSRVLLSLLSGVTVATPLLFPVTAYAQPKPQKGTLTIAGIVTRDTPGNDFYVRSDDGNRFLVVSANQPTGVSEGVRVKITGYYDGNQLSASDISILDSPTRNGDRDQGLLDVIGTVTRDPGGNDFYIRDDSGKIFLVVTKSQPQQVQTGVQVRVKGWFDGDHLNATDVAVLGNDDNFDRNDYTFGQEGQNITVTGVVTRDTPGHDFYVRTDEGQRYLVVTLKQPKEIDIGVRVRITGRYDGNRLSANTNDIEVLDYAKWDDNTQEGYLDVKGTVTKDLQGNDFVIRSKNDTTYLVITQRQPKGIAKGAQVRVKGWFDGDHLNATDVDVLKKANTSMGVMGSMDAYKNKYVTIIGTVNRLTKNNSFFVRDGAGMTYLVVTAKQPNDLEIGARVQVFGYYNGSVLTSNKSSIKILD